MLPPTRLETPAFEVGEQRSATRPPEARGLQRDGVKLLVARPGNIEHTTFAQLGDHLLPGDLVVVNTSATLAAALDGSRADGRPVVVHVAGPARTLSEELTGRATAPATARPAVPAAARPTAGLVVELRRLDGQGPQLDGVSGEVIVLAGGASLTLERPATPSADVHRTRLWVAHLDASDTPDWQRYLDDHGRAITYHYVNGRWPLEAYQTVFAREPGSAEMASAARPFSPEVVTDLVARGIGFATVTLHTGVSSLEANEPPQAERFEVPARTADLVALARRTGGRVVAVGTTVTRALETVAGLDGSLAPGRGWTDLVLSTDRPARVVGGLITGWHEAEASHLHLLRAVAGPALVEQAYAAALDTGYRWHEFGDSCLLLP